MVDTRKLLKAMSDKLELDDLKLLCFYLNNDQHIGNLRYEI